MDDRPHGNDEFEERDIFAVVNPYFLLFFSLSCILSSVFLQQIFILVRQFRVGISIAPMLGIVAPIFLLTRRFTSGFAGQLRIRKPRPKMMLYVVLSTLAAVVVVDFVYVAWLRVMPAPTDYVESLRELKPDGALALVVTFVGLCAVVPLAEEIVFRGVVQRVFMIHMGPVLGVVLAGVFFGVIHLNPQLLPSMTVFGIFLGFVFLYTANLSYTIVAHAVLNSVAFVQLVFSVDEDMSSAPFYLQGYWMLVVALVALVVLVVIIKKEAPGDNPEASLTGPHDPVSK